MKIYPYNNNQGRWRDEMPRLGEPQDLPVLEHDTVIGWVWIASLVALVSLCFALLAGSVWIARKFYAEHEARETVAHAICFEKYGQYGQWRYQSESELWCSSAVTGDVRVVML